MKTGEFLIAAAMLAGTGGVLLAARGQTARGSQADASLAVGKKLFVEKCAKCHGEDGTKPVGDGPALSERKLSDEQLQKNVRGRLKSASEDEQRGVAAYIRSFQKK